MTFLSYIQGPLVNDWVKEQAQWLIMQVTLSKKEKLAKVTMKSKK